MGEADFPPLPFLPSSSPSTLALQPLVSVPSPSPSLFLLSSSHLLQVGPLNLARGSGERCERPSRVWGGVPAEIEFGAF